MAANLVYSLSFAHAHMFAHGRHACVFVCYFSVLASFIYSLAYTCAHVTPSPPSIAHSNNYTAEAGATNFYIGSHLSSCQQVEDLPVNYLPNLSVLNPHAHSLCPFPLHILHFPSTLDRCEVTASIHALN